MAQKRWVIGVTAFLLVAMLLAGFVAIAAEVGSKEDPIVSSSYMYEEFQPQLMAKIDEIVKGKSDEYATTLNAKFAELTTQLEQRISGVSGGGSANLANDAAFVDAVAAAVIAKMPAGSTNVDGAVFQKVEVKSGKTVKCEIGTELILRGGSATCVAASSPGLINLSTGGELANGKALEKSNHYISTIAGRGFKATADVTIFIRGKYTIA